MLTAIFFFELAVASRCHAYRHLWSHWSNARRCIGLMLIGPNQWFGHKRITWSLAKPISREKQNVNEQDQGGLTRLSCCSSSSNRGFIPLMLRINKDHLHINFIGENIEQTELQLSCWTGLIYSLPGEKDRVCKMFYIYIKTRRCSQYLVMSISTTGADRIGFSLRWQPECSGASVVLRYVALLLAAGSVSCSYSIST